MFCNTYHNIFSFLFECYIWKQNYRGVARNFLEGASKSSKMLATMVERRRKIFGYGTAETVNLGPFSMRFHVL